MGSSSGAMNVPSEGHTQVVEELKDRIRRMRLARGLTQNDLAARTGISQPQISEYERGRSIPGAEYLVRVARLFGVTAEWLVEGGPGPGPDSEEKPHWGEFLERYEHIGELTSEELNAIKNFAARTHRIGSWYDWAQLAEWYRNRKPSPTFLAAVEANRREDEDAEKTRGSGN